MKEFTKEDIKHFVQFGTGGSFSFLNALLEDLTVLFILIDKINL